MDDSEIACLLRAASVPVSARGIAIVRIFHGGERHLTLEDVYRAVLRSDAAANFVGVARTVRKLWLSGLLERKVTTEKSGRDKAVFSALRILDASPESTAR